MAAGAALLTAVVLTVGTSTRRVVWTSFWCPLQKRHVTVGFLADRWRRDRYGDVLACSAFAAPWQVSCDKRCLHLPEAYRAPTADEVGAGPDGCAGHHLPSLSSLCGARGRHEPSCKTSLDH
jgi:hypothetical protein